MRKRSDSVADSYQRHSDREDKIVVTQRLPSCYTNPDSVDAWRHRRMRDSLLPLIRGFPKAKWLTIGDGNFGSDAYFLSGHNIDVVASSLTVSSLVAAQELGYITHAQSVNAEEIQFDDNSFDFVLCKESYHHFPRPAIAFYEMLRVASTGVILIEPIEGKGRVGNRVKNLLKAIFRGDRNVGEFEMTGNFVYRISEREVAKMLTALNYGESAIRCFNDCFLPRFGSSTRRPFSIGLGVTAAGISMQDFLCRIGLLDYGLATIISLKQALPLEVRRLLLDSGYRLNKLPKNPYL